MRPQMRWPEHGGDNRLGVCWAGHIQGDPTGADPEIEGDKTTTGLLVGSYPGQGCDVNVTWEAKSDPVR